jgi:hypothetical protein
MTGAGKRTNTDRRQDDRRGKSEDRRKLSIEEIFTSEDIDWSKLGLKGDRRKNDRRAGRDQRSGKDRRDS